MRLISHTRASCNMHPRLVMSVVAVSFHTHARVATKVFRRTWQHCRRLISHTRASCNQKRFITSEEVKFVSFHTHARVATAEIMQTSQRRYSVFVAFAHTFCMKWRSRHLWSAIFGANLPAFLCTHIVRTQLVNTSLGSA